MGFGQSTKPCPQFESIKSESIVSSERSDETVSLLLELEAGKTDAVEKLFPILYDELRGLARSHLKSQQHIGKWSSAELVSEAYLKLVKQEKVTIKGRSHFFALSSQVMRQLLVDDARRRKSQKRGGEQPTFDIEATLLSRKDPFHILAIHDALLKLSEINPRHAQIVEMRFFGGMTVEEVATYLGVSKRTFENDWTLIRAWLRRELSEEGE